MVFRILFVIAFFLFCYQPLLASEVTVDDFPVDKNLNNLSSVNVSALDGEGVARGEAHSEGKLYKLLYEQARSSNEQIINIVSWSVGLVATFLFALAGSQVFYNFRLAKEELNSIRSNNESLIAELGANLHLSVQEKFDRLDAESLRRNEELSKFEGRILEASQAKFDKFESDESLRKDEFLKLFGGRIDLVYQKIDVFGEGFNSKLSGLSIELKRIEAHVWGLRG